MSGKLDWKPKTVGETVVRYADFTDELATGVSVNTVAMTSTVYSGNDPAPQGIIGGQNTLNNYAGVPAVVAVVLAAGVLGTIYQVVVAATTNLARIITKTAALAIKPPLN
jgi:hypothetical protein